MSISIGMVGLGAFGSGFVNLFKAHPLVDRIAFCDMEADKVKRYAEDPFMGRKFDAKDVYFSLDEICKSDLDALAIITQPWLHAGQCLQALASGKHVFSAVPVLSTPDGDEILEACNEIISTVQSTGKHYMLGETSYYHPEVMFLRRKQKEGAFGHFVSAEAEYTHDYYTGGLRHVIAHRTASKIGAEWPRILRRKYLSRGIYGGPMHYPTHSVSGPVSIMNAHAVKVSAIGTKPIGYDDFFELDGDFFSNETAFFHMSNGAVLTAREHREIAGGEGYEISIYGKCGVWRNNQWFWVRREYGTRPDHIPEFGAVQPTKEEMRDPLPRNVQRAFILTKNQSLTDCDTENMVFTPEGHGGSHPYLVHEFVSAVAEDRVPAINAWEASRYMAMGVMAHKSALKDGELLDVPNWGDAPGHRAV